ncbi:hypothetical protein [Aerosakkonema funiforme]|uniref:Uncharacterized protein n=1 Tax=Aerosakkonema funiforme FACHB-1375 TaxID=2949571 RepID=A0A926VGF9_9CYAN|nr:hypothetical protein [Aerosakkonema funiforme]MBD2182322.1 hypothetical protein [Aerosakkonema funiforme FACHB-1375]
MPHFRLAYCKLIATIAFSQTLKLFNCQGSGVFREPPQVLAPASVHENYGKPMAFSCQAFRSMVLKIRWMGVRLVQQALSDLRGKMFVTVTVNRDAGLRHARKGIGRGKGKREREEGRGEILND